jgi:hypothetical protein
MPEENVSVAGTAEETAVSTDDTQVVDQVAEGDEGNAPEPEVEVEGQKVPLSVLKRALKNDARFTQVSTELAKQRKELEARQREIEEARQQLEAVRPLLERLGDKQVAQRLAEAVPELAEAIPRPEVVQMQRLLAENVRLKFEMFAQQAKDLYDESELDEIRAEAARLASNGLVEEAMEFDKIGYRLFADRLVEKKARAIAEEMLKKQDAEAQAKRRAATVPPAAQHLEAGRDPNKMSPIELLALARRKKAR